MTMSPSVPQPHSVSSELVGHARFITVVDGLAETMLATGETPPAPVSSRPGRKNLICVSAAARATRGRRAKERIAGKCGWMLPGKYYSIRWKRRRLVANVYNFFLY